MATPPPTLIDEGQVVINGVDALTGGPLLEPQSVAQIASLALAEFRATSADARNEVANLSEIKLSRAFGMDVERLDDPAIARWGVIVPAGKDGAVLRQALKPLIDHRARQLGLEPKVFEVGPDTSAVQFLRDNGVERGLGVVANVPYYLLIAGSPAQIPFGFQMELNTEYATGRLHFTSREGHTDYASCAAYAEHLVRYERDRQLPNRREAVFWAPERTEDPATSKSAPFLAQPLFDKVPADLKFDRRLYRGDLDPRDGGVRPATRENLRAVLAGPRPPALLFTASHGMGYRGPHPDQPARQGALLGQEYVWGQQVSADQWYGAEDLARDNANVRGLIHFAFACYGAGTPRFDDYGISKQESRVIADHAFVAALPCAMLARGALAFIGHVDRAWGFSFLGAQPALRPGVITPLDAFQRAIARILRGVTIAHALRDEYDRGIHLSSSLLETIARHGDGSPVAQLTLARLWIERNDARAYLLLGDPAARLRPETFAPEGARIAVPGVDVRPEPAPPPPAPVPAAPPPAAGDHPGGVSYQPPIISGQSKEIDQALLVAWKDYIKAGFAQSNAMFQQVLRAFMVPYWVTVVMYALLFAVGLGGFVLAAVLAVRSQLAFAAIFGGLSVVSFLTFFISGPLRSLEQNLIFITWLGIIYNTYWNRLMNTNDPQTVQQDIEAITKTTLHDLNTLVSRQERLSRRRPGRRDADDRDGAAAADTAPAG